MDLFRYQFFNTCLVFHFLQIMAPKKRRKLGFPAKPGIVRQYLTENFSPVPDGELKNGHILFLFMENERVSTRTIEAATKIIGVPGTILPYQVKTLVDRTLEKFKNLARECEMEKLDEICHETFSLFNPSSSDSPCASAGMSAGPIIPQPETHTEPEEPQPSSSTGPITPRKRMLKRRLEFVSKTRIDMKKKHVKNLKFMRGKLLKRNKVNTLIKS